MKCSHKDGWLVALPNEYILLGEEIEVKISCNHIGCKVERKIRVQILETL